MSTVVETCRNGLQQISNRQTPHAKVIYCHEEQSDIPAHLTIQCKRCGRSVDTIPNEIYITFTNHGPVTNTA